MSVDTITLGCRLNYAESETVARSAPADQDWIVVNSCAVTNEAVRQTRQAVRRAHREQPDAQILVTGCAGSPPHPQKPFDQMTAQEHRQAAARENQLADASFAKIRVEGIAPAETLPGYDIGDYDFAYRESGGAIPYTYAPGVHEIDDPEAYIAWPRVSDPSEKHVDAASEHRESALRHERAAAALEGRPEEQPLPPESPPLLEPEQT